MIPTYLIKIKFSEWESNIFLFPLIPSLVVQLCCLHEWIKWQSCAHLKMLSCSALTLRAAVSNSNSHSGSLLRCEGQLVLFAFQLLIKTQLWFSQGTTFTSVEKTCTREPLRDRVQLLLSFMPEFQIGKVSQAIGGVSFTIKSITRILASQFLCYKICICKCQILNSTYKRMHVN